jgi:tRNA (guanine37-N1)-methyltransferase
MTFFETYSSITVSMQFHVVTLFPESFDSYINESIIGRAIKSKKIKINFVNPRMFVSGKYKKVWPDGNVSRIVDDRPYGGGPGMVMRAEPILKSVESIIKKIEKRKTKCKTLIVFLSPTGELFTTDYAKKSAKSFTDIIFICGRYEGIDSRVVTILSKQKTKAIQFAQVSIGDFVLTGGELPAMVMIDCMARQIPGVLGNFDSREEERVSSSEIYTRPEVLEWNKKKYSVPEVLLSGDHKKMDQWKQSMKKDQ